MHLIKNNPYRTVGLLVGATAKEQTRQIKRLKQFIEAEQEPTEDFSFPTLGSLQRTLNSVEDAASKLNLDKDKINAALFWFWSGNPISDEAAFDALKNADIETAYQIWDNLITETKEDGKRFWKPITEKNYSAYHNCSVINLIKANGNLNNAIVGNLYFLESDLVTKFVSTIADETHKTTKKELQLLFLNQLHSEIEANKTTTLTKFIEILNKQEFIAKEDFLKGFIQKPIEQIEQKIESAKNKRKASKANGAKVGQELFASTSNELTHLKSIISTNDIKYTSIADKVANEILQCSIDYFNDSQERDSNTNYTETAMKLAKLADNIAVGRLTKDRVKDSIATLEEMKDKEISQAIGFLQSIKDAYEENKREINQQVRHLEATDIGIILGHKSINRSAVEENIRNSINWQKVNDMLNTVLSENNLKKIKESDNNELKNEFLELANWLKENSLKSYVISAIIDKYKKIPPKLPFKIISSVITNTDKDNNPLPVTNPLYNKHTRFVGLKINVECFENRSITFYKKYIGTDGRHSSNSKVSPKGYTNSTTISINTNTRVLDLSGWGSNSSCTYSIGKHRIEVYIDDYLIHSKDFIVDLAPSEKLEIDLKKAEDKLKEIRNTEYFKSELETANFEMSEVQKFQMFRGSSTKQMQIAEQQRKIASILQKAKSEKERLIEQQNKIIYKIKSEIQNAEY